MSKLFGDAPEALRTFNNRGPSRVMDPENVNYHYCDDLPTQPLPGNNRVLVTGANGYIAHRLIPELIARGYTVRCMVRSKESPVLLCHPRIEIVYADCLKLDELRPALEGVDFAYYLIHSMHAKREKFWQLDKMAAKNFIEVAEECGVKKVVYLGGLGETNERMSDHLRSRQEVGLTLADSNVTVIRLRAGIIIGTGSTSYELLKSLVMVNRWIPFHKEFNSKCQPIAIRDVIKYMVGILETETPRSRMYMIGGPDVLTYKDLLLRFAVLMGRKVQLVDVSWVPLPIDMMCRVYAYWLNFFVSVPVNVISLLLASLKTDVICTNDDIKKILPFEPLNLKTAVRWAQDKEKKSQVYSHWGGVPPSTMTDLLPLSQYEANVTLVDEHSINIPASPHTVFQVIQRIGGEHGWLSGNLLWEIRGFIDKLLGGVGLQRGRRDEKTLRVGDAVDFWRVEKIEPDRELLLRAEMLSPGLSWLQFLLRPEGPHSTGILLKAHFIPFPFWGRIYWVTLSGFHNYIFKGMLNHFYKEAVRLEANAETRENREAVH